MIELRQERFAIDIDVGVDSEIFVASQIAKFDYLSFIQKVGKALFFKVSKFALLFVSAFQLRGVDSPKTDGDILSGNCRMLIDVTGEGVAVENLQKSGDFYIGVELGTLLWWWSGASSQEQDTYQE